MKTVLITGGTAGIGLAATKLFLQNGWQVMMAARNADKGTAVKTELAAEFGAAIDFCQVDVSDERSVAALHDFTVERFGTIDALVNDAGIVVKGRLHETSLDDWERVFAVNVRGTFLISKAFLPDMIASHAGMIVNIASVSGMAGDYAMTAYNATKGAIINMTRAMAMDYGPLGIRVNSVSPGPTNTAMFPQTMFPQTMKERFSQNSPLQRIVEPSEVAAAIYFMSTEASSAITGENIPVTAGFEIGTGQPKQA